MRRIAVLALAPALLVACGGTEAAAPSEPAKANPRGLFAYDRSAPLRFRDAGVVNKASYAIRVHDVSFASPRGGRVTGYLVVPPGNGRWAAVIYLHGSGGNRVQFLAPAGWMASRGAIGLTLDSPEARSTISIAPGAAGLRQQRDLTAQQIVELERAVDLLVARPDVDPKRIAFLGWSYGARIGALLSGVDHRIASFDLISAGSLPPREYARLAPKQLRKTVLATLGAVDPLRYVRRAAPSALLLQNGRKDKVVPRKALDALARAASRPKTIRWYPGGHAPSAREYRDSLAWLSRRLGLHGVVVRGVSTGP